MVRQATAKKQMELETMDLRYRSLQTQISPHFICNILASVKGLNSLGRKDEVNRLLEKASPREGVESFGSDRKRLG